MRLSLPRLAPDREVTMTAEPITASKHISYRMALKHAHWPRHSAPLKQTVLQVLNRQT